MWSFKDILSKKIKLEIDDTVVLNENVSAILQKKLPPKLKDPRSFSIPYTIGDISFARALYNFGVSINLISLSVFEKLGLEQPKPMFMFLQFVDRSITYPRGIMEDKLINVDKFIFLVDFVVLNIKEDKDMPIILGQPILAIEETLIDVKRSIIFEFLRTKLC